MTPIPGAALLFDSTVESSLARVREGLDRRSADMARRVGDLTSYVYRPGKMLRARFCVMLGNALGVEPAKSETCGMVAELVHNASLLHDDCIDSAELRRGHPTPNAQFGTSAAILLGDLAFTEALDEVFTISPEAARGISDAVREMTIGELQEEFLKGSLKVSIESYMGVAARKTGALFEWCGQAMSHLSPLEHDVDDPPKLGRLAGILLQIVDDIHDFTLDSDAAGKQQGKDMLEARPTLPVILSLEDARRKDEARRLWQASRTPEGAAALSRFLKGEGYLEAARGKAGAMLEEMIALARSLPNEKNAKALGDFFNALAFRQF